MAAALRRQTEEEEARTRNGTILPRNPKIRKGIFKKRLFDPPCFVTDSLRKMILLRSGSGK